MFLCSHLLTANRCQQICLTNFHIWSLTFLPGFQNCQDPLHNGVLAAAACCRSGEKSSSGAWPRDDSTTCWTCCDHDRPWATRPTRSSPQRSPWPPARAACLTPAAASGRGSPPWWPSHLAWFLLRPPLETEVTWLTEPKTFWACWQWQVELMCKMKMTWKITIVPVLDLFVFLRKKWYSTLCSPPLVMNGHYKDSAWMYLSKSWEFGVGFVLTFFHCVFETKALSEQIKGCKDWDVIW